MGAVRPVAELMRDMLAGWVFALSIITGTFACIGVFIVGELALLGRLA